MRIEDYQKWLDSQFVDEAAPEQNRAQAPVAPVPVPEPVVTAPPTPPPPVQAADPVTMQMPAALAKPPVTPAARVSQPIATPADEPPDAEEVPSIERYLPFLRGRSETLGPVQAALEVEMAEEAQAREPEPVAQVPQAPAAADAPEAVEPPAAHAAPEVEEPPVVEAAPSPQTSEPVAAAPVVEPEKPRRSRLARAVRTTDIVPPMESADLWGLVPKHLHALMALGNDDEVAQNSYSRQFRESRAELISRLLDPTLSLEDTARLLNVCPATVRRYTNRGLLTHQRTAGDQRRFKLSDVLAFLETQTRARQQPPA